MHHHHNPSITTPSTTELPDRGMYRALTLGRATQIAVCLCHTVGSRAVADQIVHLVPDPESGIIYVPVPRDGLEFGLMVRNNGTDDLAYGAFFERDPVFEGAAKDPNYTRLWVLNPGQSMIIGHKMSADAKSGVPFLTEIPGDGYTIAEARLSRCEAERARGEITLYERTAERVHRHPPDSGNDQYRFGGVPKGIGRGAPMGSLESCVRERSDDDDLQLLGGSTRSANNREIAKDVGIGLSDKTHDIATSTSHRKFNQDAMLVAKFQLISQRAVVPLVTERLGINEREISWFTQPSYAWWEGRPIVPIASDVLRRRR